jgi:hypothetical protein
MNADGEVALLVKVPVKPTVAVPPGGMVALQLTWPACRSAQVAAGFRCAAR